HDKPVNNQGGKGKEEANIHQVLCRLINLREKCSQCRVIEVGNMWQCSLGRKLIGLIGCMCSAKRPVDEKVSEIKGRPVKHDRSNDFMGATPRFEYPDDAPPDSPCQRTANEHSRDE